jgi:outer membrane protein TolC
MKILMLAIFFLSGVAAGQDSITVEQAVQRVLQTHPVLGQALANIRAAEARTLQASSSQFPEISTDAVYTHIGPVPEFSFLAFGSIVLAPADNYDAHVSGKYTVFDFGKTSAAVDLSQSRVQASRDAIELTKTNLALQTVRTFYMIMLLQRSLQVQDEQIEALTQHISVTQKRVTAGSATNFDVLTTQVRVASSQNQRVEIQNSLQKQESVFRQLLNLSTNVPLLIRGSFQQTPLSLNMDSLQQIAMYQRAELKLARDAEESARLQKNASSRGNMPSLKIIAAYGFKNGYEPNIYLMRGNWMWGAQAQIPLFDGGKVSHQEEEAQAAIESEQAHTQDADRQIRSDVEQAVADVQASWSKVQISDVQLQQAHEAVAIARTRYETGSVTNLDLLDAETAESSARLMSLQALYRFVISKYELDRAVGGSLFP